MSRHSVLIMIRILAVGALLLSMAASAEPWPRHTIDNTAEGADGARLADFNGDGLLDISTPFEEGGVVRVFIHPGNEKVREPWPIVHVDNIKSGEDAVMADLDKDGHVDVITCAEGNVRTTYIHWNKGDATFETAPIAESEEATQWMFALPIDVNKDGRLDIVAGAKNDNAEIGWFESPEDPRDAAAWQWHAWAPVGWIMSIEAFDINRDGRQDVVYSDRRGENRGLYWIDLKSSSISKISAFDDEYMFLGIGEWTGPESFAVTAAASKGPTYIYRGSDWSCRSRINLLDEHGMGKSSQLADIDGDDGDRPEVIISCEHSEGKHGVFYFDFDDDEFHTISGLEGTKFDLLQIHDVDNDGDLDVITCEERENLGVIWYENPLK